MNDKANDQEQPQDRNSPGRKNQNDQEEGVTSQTPPQSVSPVEFGAPSSDSGPTRVSTNEIAGSSPTVTPTGATSGAGMDLNIEEGSSRRRPGEKAEDSITPEPKRPKGEMDAPISQPICSQCGRRFSSWKAVFGHMRAHPDRGWRGAFPPPKGDRSLERSASEGDLSALQSQLAPTLLSLAIETLERMNKRQNEAGSSTRLRDFDLNAEPRDSSGPSQSPSPRHRRNEFDLNEPPRNDSKDN